MLKQHFKQIYLVILLIFFTPLQVKSEIVKGINIEGNQRIPDETIKMFGKIGTKKNINLNEIDKILKNIYDSSFFTDVKVIFENNILNIYVKEKPIIQSIEYQGIKSKTILEEIKVNRILKPKSSFDKTVLKKDIKTILSTLRDKGYLFVNVENFTEDTENQNLN